MRAILGRLKRLETVRAIQSRARIEVQIGHLKKLSLEYHGERHIVTVSRLPNGDYQWEERPGPPAEEHEKPDPVRLLRVVWV